MKNYSINLFFDNGKEENIFFKTKKEAENYFKTLKKKHTIIGEGDEGVYLESKPFNFCASLTTQRIEERNRELEECLKNVKKEEEFNKRAFEAARKNIKYLRKEIIKIQQEMKL